MCICAHKCGPCVFDRMCVFLCFDVQYMEKVGRHTYVCTLPVLRLPKTSPGQDVLPRTAAVKDTGASKRDSSNEQGH